jgi:hypothetical protein
MCAYLVVAEAEGSTNTAGHGGCAHNSTHGNGLARSNTRLHHKFVLQAGQVATLVHELGTLGPGGGT